MSENFVLKEDMQNQPHTPTRLVGTIESESREPNKGIMSYLRHRGSSPDIAGQDQRKANRRFSLFDLIKRKSSSALNEQGIEEIEEEDIFDDYERISEHNEKLLISFADIYSGHDNLSFQPDTHGSEYNISFFGKKGKAKGEFQDVKDITIMPDNRLLITDFINSRIQLCNAAGRLLLMYSGSDVTEPWATACIDNKTIAMTSRKNRCVRVLDLDGEVINSFGDNFFSAPTGIAVDSLGNFIVCDACANTVSVHDSNGIFVRYLGDPNTQNGCFFKPRYVCISYTGDIIVSDSGNHRIIIFDSSFEFIRSFGSFGKGIYQFKSPYGVCANDVGDIYVADHYNNRISVFTRNAVFIRHLVTSDHGLRHPQGLALKSGTHLFVSHGDLKASEILVYKLDCHVDSNESDIICHL